MAAGSGGGRGGRVGSRCGRVPPCGRQPLGRRHRALRSPVPHLRGGPRPPTGQPGAAAFRCPGVWHNTHGIGAHWAPLPAILSYAQAKCWCLSAGFTQPGSACRSANEAQHREGSEATRRRTPGRICSIRPARLWLPCKGIVAALRDCSGDSHCAQFFRRVCTSSVWFCCATTAVQLQCKMQWAGSAGSCRTLPFPCDYGRVSIAAVLLGFDEMFSIAAGAA